MENIYENSELILECLCSVCFNYIVRPFEVPHC